MPVITSKVAQIRAVFQEYKKARHQIMALDIVNQCSLTKISRNSENINWCRTIVKYTQTILMHMSRESCEIITHLYINELEAKQLNYSQSSFYLKHKKAVNEFITLMNLCPQVAERITY
ncbi:hypothetical protein OF377_00545 [Ureaplasma sp. ES3154-GEN]|uniref:MG284/MPN403 family protein n=1 Tax=Ureaplasma sp. ES3154-GEN TaxID=2984844 RepID=UPI0021E7EBE8|nr:hypothetical protein [Ureaplasma sp. ES3154-GEN]MCV3743375.1 hypothetical protein [Ureaplasma sp. ES3154-GEN]